MSACYCTGSKKEAVVLTWQPYHEELMRSWKKQAAINLWLALASKYRYDIINNWLTYPCVIISAFTSIGIIGIESYVAGRYVMSGLTMFAAIMTAVNKHFGAAEKSHEFYMRSKDYYAFIREIDYLLTVSSAERPPVDECMMRLRSTFDRIVDLQLEPPLEIIREYEKKFRPLETSILDLQGEIIQDDDSMTISSKESHNDDGIATGLNGILNSNMMRTTNKRASMPGQSIIMMPYQLYTHPITSVNPELAKSRRQNAGGARASVESNFVGRTQSAFLATTHQNNIATSSPQVILPMTSLNPYPSEANTPITRLQKRASYQPVDVVIKEEDHIDKMKEMV